MQVQIKDGKLLIAIPINDPPKASESGKSLVVATTHGNQKTEVEFKGKKLVVGLTAYVPAKDK